MKFVLVEEEIKQAIKEYAAKLITVAPGATVIVDVKNTRGADGVTAEIDVSLIAAGVTAAVAPVDTPVKREAAPAPAAAQPAEPTPAEPAPAVIPQQPPVEPEVPVAAPIGQAPDTAPQEPTIPDDEQAPLEGEGVAPTAGKSIFG